MTEFPNASSFPTASDLAKHRLNEWAVNNILPELNKSSSDWTIWHHFGDNEEYWPEKNDVISFLEDKGFKCSIEVKKEPWDNPIWTINIWIPEPSKEYDYDY